MRVRWNRRPRWIVCLMCLKILLIAWRYEVLDWCKNWHTWFTTNAISGQVRVRYWRLPTILGYSVELGSSSPSRADNHYQKVGIDLSQKTVRDLLGIRLLLTANWRKKHYQAIFVGNKNYWRAFIGNTYFRRCFWCKIFVLWGFTSWHKSSVSTKMSTKLPMETRTVGTLYRQHISRPFTIGNWF